MTGGAEYFLYGSLGGVLVDGMLLVQAVQRVRRRSLSPYSRWDWWAAEGVRVTIGGVLASLFYLSHEVSTPVAAAVVGMTAPMLIERLASVPPPVDPARGG